MNKKYIAFVILGVIIVLISVWGLDKLRGGETSLASAEEIIKEVKKEANCDCGCSLTLEGCEKYDPTCPVRPGIVGQVEELAEDGKTKEEILAALNGEVVADTEVDLEDDDPFKGSDSAPVTIVEFSDFQCPFCASFYSQTLDKIEKEYIDTGKVKLVYRDFPLSFHKYAQKTAEAAECAEEQGKFWEYHNILFERQPEWSSQGVPKLKEYARELGLNDSFDSCLDSGLMEEEVLNDFSDGRIAGVSGTPAFFIEGELVSGAQPFGVFSQKIEQHLK